MTPSSQLPAGTISKPFYDNKGPIRSLWPDIDQKRDELHAAIEHWLTESRLPGSSQKRKFAISCADGLLKIARGDPSKDVEWFFSQMEECIDTIIKIKN